MTVAENNLKKNKEYWRRRAVDCDARSAQWLANANRYFERGETPMADDLYDKAQYWLDRANKARDNMCVAKA